MMSRLKSQADKGWVCDMKSLEEHSAFSSWLKGNIAMPYSTSDGADTDVFVKVPFDEDFIFIYHQRNYFGVPQDRHIPFVYCGFYNSLDGLLYDAEPPLKRFKLGFDSGKSFLDLSHEFEKQVRQRIEKIVYDERNNLKTAVFSKESYNQQLEDFRKHDADYLSKMMFLNNESADNIKYECDYVAKPNITYLILNYLKYPDETVSDMAIDYWQSKQDDILFELNKNEILRNKLQEIETDLDNPIHKQRAIINALQESSAKTVNLTIYKDGQEFSFKYDADRLRRYANSNYGIWEMSSKDRQGYEDRFGRYRSFYPEDIIEISYRGKTIYEADVPDMSEDSDLTDEESEDSDEGFVMSM